MNQQQIVTHLTPLLKNLEEERIRIKNTITRTAFVAQTILIGGAVLAVLFASTVLPTLGEDGQFLIILFCSFIFMLWCFQAYIKKKNAQKSVDFEYQVKTEVYEKIFHTWNSSSQYIPDACVEEDYFRAAGLHHGYSIYKGDDYCEGQLADGRSFQFSELLTQRVVQDWSDSAPHKIPVFKGLFFVIDNTLPFEGFEGRLTIEPKPKEESKQKKTQPKKSIPKPKKFHEGVLDADFLSQQVTKKSYDPKKTIPSLFDRIYTVNDVGNPFAKEKLSVDFCQQLGYLRSLLNHQISVTFYQNKVYFSSRHQLDFWPVTVDHALLTEARVRHVAANFAAAFLLLEKIANTTLPTTNS
ncbi:MAG: hypothetical protein AB8E82_00555 [Aureispira sp.]